MKGKSEKRGGDGRPAVTFRRPFHSRREDEKKRKGGFLWFLRGLAGSVGETLTGGTAASGGAGAGAGGLAAMLLPSDPVAVVGLAAVVGIGGGLLIAAANRSLNAPPRAVSSGTAAISFPKDPAAAKESFARAAPKASGGMELFRDAVKSDNYFHQDPAVERAKPKIEIAAETPSSQPAVPMPELDLSAKHGAAGSSDAAAFKAAGFKSSQGLSLGSGGSGGSSAAAAFPESGAGPRSVLGKGFDSKGRFAVAKAASPLSARLTGAGARHNSMQQLLAANMMGKRAANGFGVEAGRYAASQVFDNPGAAKASIISGGGGLSGGGTGMAAAKGALAADPSSVAPPVPTPQNQDSSTPWADLAKQNMLLMLAGVVLVALANKFAATPGAMQWVGKALGAAAIAVAGFVIKNAVTLSQTYGQTMLGVVHGGVGALIAAFGGKAMFAQAPADGGREQVQKKTQTVLVDATKANNPKSGATPPSGSDPALGD